MKATFIGCGDAFGSGGRFNTCIHVEDERGALLLDCGASSLIAMKKIGIDRGAIDAILLTHFHADHFGGIPFFLLDAQLNVKRTAPLLIAGPPGLRGWYERAMALAFPGERTLPYELILQEVSIGEPAILAGRKVTAFPVRHDERAGPCLAYRIENNGKTLCYSGDTEWTETLLEAAHDADLFICECYMFEKPRKSHMSLAALRPQLPRIGAKRVVLTHLSEDMLAHLSEVELDCAVDGLVIEV
ncbi:MAG: MBL fold metallo-hydrolase [Pseudorhodoplanes sp.]